MQKYLIDLGLRVILHKPLNLNDCSQTTTRNCLSWRLRKGITQTHILLYYGITNKFLNPIMGVDLAQPHVLTLYVALS